jgi:hypothetical protein
MSWLKLTKNYLFLMKGGSYQYIDRISINDQKIKDFPRRWFSSIDQRPRTMIVTSTLAEDDLYIEDNIESFTKNELFKKLEVSVSFKFFEEMKKRRTIPELIDMFKKNIGDFTDEFFEYEDEISSKTLNVQPPEFTYSTDVKAKNGLNFPDIDFDPRDIDFSRATPSFASIFLGVMWQAEVTVRPYLAEYSDSDTKIRVRLEFIKRPDPKRSSRAVSLSTLEKAVKPIIFDATGKSTIRDVLVHLKEKSKIVATSPDLGDENNNLDFTGQRTFTDILDLIASNYDGAFWDWVGDTAILTKTKTNP